MFEGDNSSAQLHRNNRTIYLQLNNGIKTILYKTDVINMLEFSWTGFKVNGTKMEKVKLDADFSLKFSVFTFLSPLTNFSCFDIRNEEKLLNSSNLTSINYSYIVGIVLIVAIVFDFKPKTWNLIRNMISIDNKCIKTGLYDTLKTFESTI